ncbi:flagellar hook assembly protein FlgD [Noviherbaspirillum aerium]|uniref:flagellar hook assembly protein FlgD n=1 Tax=Noviherbaspirillum aerium TaxID=2588497 RepID=UPI00124C280D|nr:flagellar hook assembly protein FlgD [Noviherbaspirillum aerium]
MTTVQTNNTTSDAFAASGAAKKPTNTTQEAQDRFMTLLVTQMKNQDPLNPLDNAQVTSQLAQLSTVTGIDKLNTTLQALQGSYQASQSLQAASLIGHGVLTTGSSIALKESKAVFGIELSDAADSVEISVLNSSGALVRSIKLDGQDAGVIPLAWDGKADNGSVAADGRYTFEVKALRGGEKVSATPLSYGDVLSVTTGAQGVLVNLPGREPVKLADIRQII